MSKQVQVVKVFSYLKFHIYISKLITYISELKMLHKHHGTQCVKSESKRDAGERMTL